MNEPRYKDCPSCRGDHKNPINEMAEQCNECDEHDKWRDKIEETTPHTGLQYRRERAFDVLIEEGFEPQEAYLSAMQIIHVQTHANPFS